MCLSAGSGSDEVMIYYELFGRCDSASALSVVNWIVTRSVFPILAAGDLHGGIVIVSDGAAKPTETQLVKARFLRDIIAQEVEGL